MEPAVTAIIAFGSAVLGAVAGFLGAVYIERWRIRRMRTGVVRALLGELRQNAGAVTLAVFAGTSPVMKFSSETWRAANFELAQLLSERLYRAILSLYDMLPGIEQLCNHPLGAGHARKELQGWVELVKKAMSDLQELPEAAGFRMVGAASPAELEEEAKKAS